MAECIRERRRGAHGVDDPIDKVLDRVQKSPYLRQHSVVPRHEYKWVNYLTNECLNTNDVAIYLLSNQKQIEK